ncbi:MAG TPA: NUDIX domain-containing protein [Solirubrobacteraceae bacterium]|jgi:ADP-ribose pyrophosphatase YjhB (NUDIX family)|nr:NUDIX domain-containing protein [Solirubrobacteraceae bacterium]
MTLEPGILARGPWQPADVEVSWTDEPFPLPPAVVDEADRQLAELRGRGSPSHDGLAARLVGFDTADGKLRLRCEPVRWAIRLLPGDAMQSLSAVCVVRSPDGSWLAGRRAAWLATWAERWALGAAGSVEVGENPAHTLVRELDEEWSVAPRRLTVEALVKLPSGLVSLVGQAWLGDDATVTPDSEHDEFAWWPADVSRWPEQADAPLRRLAELVSPVS